MSAPKKKKATKPVTARRRRRQPAWHERISVIAAVSRPEDVAKAIPKGYVLDHVHTLGVLGRKIWLQIDCWPDTAPPGKGRQT